MPIIQPNQHLGKPGLCRAKTFIPWKRFNGKNGQSPAVNLPLVLLQYPNLSWGAKLCWAALARYGGAKGNCYPSQERLANDLDTSVRNVRNYIAELESQAFIVRVIRYDEKGRTSDAYGFLEHPIFAPGYRKDSSATNRKDSSATGTGRILPSKRISRRLKRVNTREEEQSAPDQHSAPAVLGEIRSQKKSDDDDKPKNQNLPLENENQKPYASALDELVALMTQQLGRAPDQKLLRVVCDNAELGRHTLRDFVDDIRPRIGRLKTRAREGFFVTQAKEFAGLEQSPAAPPRLAEEAMPAPSGKCAKCGGVGQISATEFCDCPMGKDLRRATAKIEAQKAAAAAANRAPPGSETLAAKAQAG